MHLGLIWADNVLLKMTFHEEYEFVIQDVCKTNSELL